VSTWNDLHVLMSQVAPEEEFMQDFLDAVVQSLNAGGVNARLEAHGYYSATIHVGNRVEIYVNLRGPRTAVFLGRRFRRAQVLEAVMHIVARLPELASAETKRLDEAQLRQWLAPVRLQLNAAGVARANADCDNYSVTDKECRKDLLKLLLLYSQAKNAGSFAGRDHYALLEAILDNPDERLPIDVYCDYLSDNGREADAMKLRNYTGEF